MKTPRSVRDEVKSVLEFLTDVGLVRNVNDISMHNGRVSWYSYDPAVEFIMDRQHATVEQYKNWVANGSYSAMLSDASLLQITYDVAHGKVVGHRLAYVPCPVALDQTLLDEGEAVADVIDLYDSPNTVLLQSPIRFDYDPQSAKPHHPASHLTINSADCRIACVAPMHVHRFVDFVFRHFYPTLWAAHKRFFVSAVWAHLESDPFDESYKIAPHLMWDVRAQASSQGIC